MMSRTVEHPPVNTRDPQIIPPKFFIYYPRPTSYIPDTLGYSPFLPILPRLHRTILLLLSNSVFSPLLYIYNTPRTGAAYQIQIIIHDSSLTLLLSSSHFILQSITGTQRTRASYMFAHPCLAFSYLFPSYTPT